MNIQTVLKPQFQIEIGSPSQAQGAVYVLGSSSSARRKSEFRRIVTAQSFEEQRARLLESEKRTLYFTGPAGPVWILQNAEAVKGTHRGLLEESRYAWFRDQAGPLAAHFRTHQLESIALHFVECDENISRACLVGLELAQYNFLQMYRGKAPEKKTRLLALWRQPVKGFRPDIRFVEKAQLEAAGVQLARHLVNLPPNDVNPETVEQLVRYDLGFTGRSAKTGRTGGKGGAGQNAAAQVTVDVWDYKRLAQENMHLHLAVGRGSETPPRMVHIRYRPAGRAVKRPLAFVGKGITFDTGGLDIKPSAAMRLMKKDMGGAAAVLGLAYWAVHSGYNRACDFYLALAENSVDAKAMRPGDLYTSRAGFLVEIDNTDAEGRLVLADVLDVAVTRPGKDEPETVIDIATLTGAIKVALGAEMAGLFTNNDELAAQLESAGQAAGDLNWRMPLVARYFGSLSSNFADFRNSADGFGGAITAALFLEKFCRGKKWAHLDVYSWNDKTNGALSSVGGSGQPVQALIQWMKTQA